MERVHNAPSMAGFVASDPQKSEAVGLAGRDGFREEDKRQTANCAGHRCGDQAIGLGLVDRARQLGIEIRPAGSDCWCLAHSAGAAIGVVHGYGALQAALTAFEGPLRDVAALVAQRAGRAA